MADPLNKLNKKMCPGVRPEISAYKRKFVRLFIDPLITLKAAIKIRDLLRKECPKHIATGLRSLSYALRASILNHGGFSPPNNPPKKGVVPNETAPLQSRGTRSGFFKIIFLSYE